MNQRTDDLEHRVRVCEMRLEACDETVQRMTRLLAILQELVGADLWAHAIARLAAEGGAP